MYTSSLRMVFVFVLALTSMFLQGCDSDSQTSTPSQNAQSSSGPQARHTPGPRIPVSEKINIDLEETLRNIWWNGPIGGRLDLTNEQRAAMDRLLAEYLRQWPKHARNSTRAHRRFFAAIERGDLESARTIARSFGQASEFLGGETMLLKVAVLAELSSQQVDALLTDHPALLRRRWIKAGRISTHE